MKEIYFKKGLFQTDGFGKELLSKASEIEVGDVIMLENYELFWVDVMRHDDDVIQIDSETTMIHGVPYDEEVVIWKYLKNDRKDEISKEDKKKALELSEYMNK